MIRPALIIVFALASVGHSAELTPAERGKKALLETSFIPAAWTLPAYGNLWKTWEGVTVKPDHYDEAVQKYYGLHPADYPNNGLPMGLKRGKILFLPGVAVDCMVCHGGSMLGKSYVGLGNSSLDIQALFEDLGKADNRPSKLPFHFGNVRGTNEAGAMAVYLLGFREPDLKLRRPRIELGLHDDLCEDVPAWWLLKKKKTMYYTGGIDARSVRSKMQFMMTPITTREEFDRHETAFHDIQQYLLSIEAPKYPFPIDTEPASKGEKLFTQNCVRCHGTYGEKWTYPNKVIPIDEIGTDRRRYDGIEDKFGEYYNQTWFAEEKTQNKEGGGYPAKPSKGYQAPPLDGIWATAPYLHNGSVPTLYHVLKSSARPKIYTRSFQTDEASYDREKIGWKFTETKPETSSDPVKQRRVYDTTKTGRGNQGHTYGDHLTDAERMALIEYLKTL